MPKPIRDKHLALSLRWLAQFPQDAQLPVDLLAVEDTLVIEVLEKDTRALVLFARNEGFAS